MSILFEPQRIGPLEIKNRFVRSATYYGLADSDGRVGDDSVKLMRELAGNDIGLLLTGYAYVARSGQCFADQNGIDRDDQIAGYRRMTQAVHEVGGCIAMQIAHGGRASSQVGRRGEERLVVSASSEGADGTAFRELSEEDIEALVEAFGEAAGRVEAAGFDGVQIHGAHGYLVSEFLSPISNHRRDRWGGSLENRMRFVVEVTRSIQRHVGRDFPVMIKLGCRDYPEEGRGLTIEEGSLVAEALEREGVCFVEVSHGIIGRSFRRRSTGSEKFPLEEAYLVPDARVVRRAIRVPISVVGGLRRLEVMEEIVASGVADCVSLCRPFIRQPDLVVRLRRGDITAADCVSCWGCLRSDKSGYGDIRCRQLRAETA